MCGGRSCFIKPADVCERSRPAGSVEVRTQQHRKLRRDTRLLANQIRARNIKVESDWAVEMSFNSRCYCNKRGRSCEPYCHPVEKNLRSGSTY